MNISDQGYNIVDMVTLNKTLGVNKLDYWPDLRWGQANDSQLYLTDLKTFLWLLFLLHEHGGKGWFNDDLLFA